MLHARCVMILRDAEDAFDEIAQAAAEPIGTLRITAPNGYGTAMVVPVVTAFAARYPGCRVEQTLSDHKMDLASGKIDMAIRVGWLVNSSLQARRDRFLPAAPGRRPNIHGWDRGYPRSGRSNSFAVHRQHGAARTVAVAVFAR